MDRRTLLTLLAVGTAASLTACTDEQSAALSGAAPGPVPHPAPQPGVPQALARSTPPPAVEATAEALTEDPTAAASTTTPPVVIGPPQLISQLPAEAKAQNLIALTIDDGYDAETVSAYVQFAQDSGMHLTFSPNGTYQHVWNKHADALKPLIEAGQVQIGNHTYSHKDVKKLSDHGLEEELEKNEDWISQTFATTSRPWFRPPFGFRNERTDELAASLGWTNILLWNGSFGDSVTLTQKVLLQQAQKWLNPGTIMLGHANHPTVTHLYPEITALLQARSLTPRTLNEVFSSPAGSGTPEPPATR